MKEHGLRNTEDWSKYWTFDFDNSKRRLGCCHWSDKKITLSRKLVELNNEDRVRNTILHEIAHALAPRNEGHGLMWKRIAKQIGCNANRTASDSEGITLVRTEKSFRGTCPNCKKEVQRHRRTAIACGDCCNKFNYGKFSDQYLFSWERI